MSRSLRTTDFAGLKDYQISALKKIAKEKQNRDRTAKHAKTTNQNLHHTTDFTDDSEGWDGQASEGIGYAKSYLTA